MAKYRCYLTPRDEEYLSEKARKELAYLRKRLKEAEDLNTYHLYCRLGDDPPKQLAKKFDKLWGNNVF